MPEGTRRRAQPPQRRLNRTRQAPRRASKPQPMGDTGQKQPFGAQLWKGFLDGLRRRR